MTSLRAAVLCDYAEENWHSMNLVADMLLERLGSGKLSGIQATRIQPSFLRFCGVRNADRLLNRLIAYPLRVRGKRFDVFHIVDHSYAQLVHVLPSDRTVVTCHDADTFRCLFDPKREPRPRWFRAMARHILRGLQKAAYVVSVSQATRDQLLHYGLVDPARLRVIHNGVHPDFTAGAHPPTERTELLHVGSTIPRKRIDLLLQIFAECRQHDKTLHLVHVGAPLSEEQQQLATRLSINRNITCLADVPSKLLADIYRRAAILLLPSEAEGFGLPLAEAMSCGTPAAVSDIPSLREVGGQATTYYPVGDITAWSNGLLCLLEERASNRNLWYERTALSLQQAALFSWDRNAREIAALYRTL